MSKKYFLHLHNCKFEVSRLDYIDFYKQKRREKYLYEVDEAHGLVSYQAKDNDNFSGEEYIVDVEQESVEDIVVKKVMIALLREAMKELTLDELKLISALYFDKKTQVQLQEETGALQQTISYREKKILQKLKKIIES